MSTRGRPAAAKRGGVLPNLALAGKREDKDASISLKRKKANQPARGNAKAGGKGRGKGKDDRKDRPGLIESCGIFSEGLSGAERRAKPPVTEPLGSSRVKEEAVVMDCGEKKSGYACYEEMWQSDDEGDLQELSELLRDGFISDHKHGTLLPHVLPLDIEPQFVELLDKSVRDKVKQESEEVKAEYETDAKERLSETEEEEQEAEDGESPTLRQSRKAARILASLSEETRENDLFVIQLPGILKVLSQEKPLEERIVFNTPQTNGHSKIEVKEEPGLIPNQNDKPTVEQLNLPPGRSIGKLVVTKDGRVLLKVGGHSLDVAHTASEGQHQSVVMVETTPQQFENNPFMQNGTSRFGGGQNAVYYMGNVRHHFTASLDWKKLRPIGEENAKPPCPPEVVSPTKKPKPVDLERMKKELNELQRERKSEMAAALKRWNA
ncbi:hypothetical protein Q1695_005391 [Nippostrongylus brasiliensis]|nr:hypothetical protein Q1695_005391 [Nippostrongylus brasiliensis]